MFDFISFIQSHLGWSWWPLIFIPLVLLVRLLVKRSRWSILRIIIVSLVGVVVTSLWLSYVERAAGYPLGCVSGSFGKQVAEFWDDNMGRPLTNSIIANGLFVLWLLFALQDAIIATARFFINKPYIREIIKEKTVIKYVEKESPANNPPKKGPKKPADKPVKAPAPAPSAPSIDEVPAYKVPPAGLLKDRSADKKAVTKGEIEGNIAIIRETLADHHVKVADIQAVPGPTVTLYKVFPAKGVKVSAIRNLADDISVALKAGKVLATLLEDCVGLEVANRQRSAVGVRELLESPEFRESRAALPIAIGRKVTGEVKVFDLAGAPHLLIGGATGQGKSVGLNVLITSLLYAKRPSDLKLIFIDPKKTEFSRYARLYSHYLAVLPDSGSEEEEKSRAIVKDAQAADRILRSLCQEMSDRYSLLDKAGTPEIKEYEALFKAHKLNPKNGHRHLPYLVCIIDEYGQLVYSTSGSPEARAHARSIMTSIVSLAAMGRAAGIHLVIATQSPRREVVSGLIKTNFPMSIAYKVKTDQDSRIILDEMGAEKLLGDGDMIITKNATTERVQCGFINSAEIDAVTKNIETQTGYQKSFNTPYYLPEVQEEGKEGGGTVDMNALDERFEEAARTVVLSQRGSTSDLQRKLGMGYAKAGRVMDQLEAAGIVGPQNGSQKREVLVGSLEELEEILKAYKN